MAAVQNLYRRRRLWKANDDLHFLLFYENVWSTFCRQPVCAIDNIGLQVIYQTREAMLNQIFKHQAES